MTPGRERARDLEDRADALASAGDWSGLAELLEEVDRDVVLRQRSLAYRLGEALYHTGRMAELLELGRDFEESARKQADVRGVTQALNLAGMAAFQLGDLREARRRFDKLMELAESEGDTEMLARAANNLGAVANLEGRSADALVHYQLALPVYEKLGQTRGLCQTHHNVGISYRDLGRLDDASRAYLRAGELASRIQYVPVFVLSTAGRGEVELRRGDRMLGLRLAERAVKGARVAGNPILEAEALRVRGMARATGSPEERGRASSDLDEGLELAGRADNRLLRAEILQERSRLHERDGDRDRARALLREAVEIFASLGAAAAEEEARDELRWLEDAG